MRHASQVRVMYCKLRIEFFHPVLWPELKVCQTVLIVFFAIIDFGSLSLEIKLVPGKNSTK